MPDFTDQMKEDTDLHLVSTWCLPFLRTLVVATCVVGDIVTQDLSTGTGQFLFIAEMCQVLLFLDTFNQAHKWMSNTIKYAGYILLYWRVYTHKAGQSSWDFDSTGWEVFLCSLFLLFSVYILDLKLKTQSASTIQMCMIGYGAVVLMIPNAANTATTSSYWEAGFRCFLFLFSTWFCLFVLIIVNKNEINFFYFFNQFSWVLFAHRYLIPLVGIIWMRALLQATFTIGHNLESDLVEVEVNSGYVNTANKINVRDPVQDPTASTEAVRIPPNQDSHPPSRKRGMLRKWKGMPGSTTQDAVAKLQQLSVGMDPV